ASLTHLQSSAVPNEAIGPGETGGVRGLIHASRWNTSRKNPRDTLGAAMTSCGAIDLAIWAMTRCASLREVIESMGTPRSRALWYTFVALGICQAIGIWKASSACVGATVDRSEPTRLATT